MWSMTLSGWLMPWFTQPVRLLVCGERVEGWGEGEVNKGSPARASGRDRSAHFESLEGVEVAERALLAVVGDRRSGRGALGR